MCGIFGYIGEKPCREFILKALKALEYRGYDSAGIATISSRGKISFVKKKGKVANLDDLLSALPAENTVGLGHTRWATHGVVSDRNAHPHVSQKFAIIHNGIIDNYLELKESLSSSGFSFETETDTEVILKLLEKNYSKELDVEKALLKTVSSLMGSFALGVMILDHPEVLYILREKSPLIIGQGQGENLFASDLVALAPYTKNFFFLEDGQFARIKKDSIEIKNFDGSVCHPKVVNLSDYELSTNSKGSYEHFMLKEIYEQERIVSSHIEMFYDLAFEKQRELGVGLKDIDLSKYRQLVMVGCGSAYYAACVGQYTLEKHFRIPVSVFLSSEFHQRKMHIGSDTLVLALSQSGETADTLSACEYAKSTGATIIAVCNTPYSSLTRLADFTMYIQAGTEIGVASTKAFTATLLALMTLSYSFAKKLGTLESDELSKLFQNLKALPEKIKDVLSCAPQYKELAGKYSNCGNFLFMGRGHLFPIALEGALKLKEISYCHAEGYAGGELKHGPISLVTEELPIVAICPTGVFYKKMFSNMEEVAARQGCIIAVAPRENKEVKGIAETVLHCPDVDDPFLQALVSNITLQFFAYYVALKLGRHIDQPRNLAKSVTVE